MKWILVVYLKKKKKKKKTDRERKNAASISDILQRNNFVEILPLWWLDCARHPAVRKPKGNKRFTHSWCVSQSLRLIITSSFLHSHPEVYISARRWCASKENGSYICSVSANPRGHFQRKYNNWLANLFVSWYTFESIMRYTMFGTTFEVSLLSLVDYRTIVLANNIDRWVLFILPSFSIRIESLAAIRRHGATFQSLS